jgi:hypothetical protein
MASTDSMPVPKKNTAYRVVFPILDADGDLVTGATGLDSEVSKDQGTFADCTNEATEIATSSGVYYLDLTSTEMNADSVAIIVKTSSVGAKTTVIALYPQEAGDIRVDCTTWLGQTIAAVDTNGYPKVTIKNGTGTGELSFTSGIASVNATQINSSATSAAKLALALAATINGTVDTAGFAATSSIFETSSITEATADHFVGKIVLWTSGALLYQQALITAYSLSSGRGRFTVTTMTDSPANGDAFIVV